MSFASPVGLADIPHSLHTPWSNWGGNQTATPAYTVRPRNEQELLRAVRFGIRERLTIRAVGAGHSFTPVVQTGGLLIDTSGLSGVTGTDSVRHRIRALGGTPISAFGEPAWRAGISLANQGDIDKQAIAGALATGTHGSGTQLGSFSSALRWARIVDGHGEIVEIGEDDPRLLAAQTSLGALGIVLEVELQAVPRYHLQERITYPAWQETVATLERDLAENRHYSFLWCQSEESAGLYELPTPAGLSMVDRSYTKRYNAVEVEEPQGLSDAPGARIDRAYRIYPGGFGLPFHELEYYVPAQRGLEAVEALQQLIRTRHADQKYPIEVRWVRGDEGLLSPFQGRDTTVLSVSGAPGSDYWPYLQDVDALLRDFEARAHWGKIHLLTQERIAGLYPGFDAFLAVRRELDPHGVYLNDHLRSLLG